MQAEPTVESFLFVGFLLIGSLALLYGIVQLIKGSITWAYKKRKQVMHEKGITACRVCGRPFRDDPPPVVLSLLSFLEWRNVLGYLNPFNFIRDLLEGFRYLTGQKGTSGMNFCRGCGELKDELPPEK